MDTYEKKYKESLERAKKLQETCDSQAVVGWCEYIFPELKESEDERIRKALIKAISRTHKGNKLFGTDVTREEALAWLEQDSQILANSAKTCKDEWNAEKKELKKIPQRMVSAEAKEALYDKPAWSEDDEDNLNSCIEAIEACYKWDSMVDWLKSLKDRVLPQPKHEWSEEDERILDALITSLNNEVFAGRLETLKGIGISLVIDWLKFLKSRIERQ